MSVLISIITINRNNAEGLSKSIQSVLGQKGVCFEYIIVDGASTDDSVSVIKDSAARHEHVKWVSEPDSGIYNAMNKGVTMASGEYLLFLNSGDALSSPYTLSEIMPNLDNTDILVGRVHITKKGEVCSSSQLLSEKDLSLYNMYLHGIPHQAAFIKRTLLMSRPYDENLRINSDWKFFVESIVFDSAKVKMVDVFVSEYDGEGISSVQNEMLLKERETVFMQLLPERIANDYLSVFPHYYEVKRVKWLLQHKGFYKMYRAIASFGIRIN